MLKGDEGIKGTELVVADFWRWAYSDVTSNRNRGILAEFLVAQGLGSASSARVEWDAVDIRYGEVKIEVKSAAYLQAWKQVKPSTIRFNICEKLGWDAASNSSAKQASRAADVYVFCLHWERDPQKANVLDVSQWSFYIVSSSSVGLKYQKQKSIGLTQLNSLCEPCGYNAIRKMVDKVVGKTSTTTLQG